MTYKTSDGDGTIVSALTTEPGGKLLTRTQAAEVVGTSVSTWRRHIEGRLIQSIKNGNKNLFVETDVIHVRDQVTTHLRRGEAPSLSPLARDVYAKVLDALDAGKNVVDVARDLDLFIEEVEPVHQRWLLHRRAVYLDNSMLEKMWRAIETHFGPGRQLKHDSGEGLIAFIHKMALAASAAEDERKCIACPSGVVRRAMYCATCADEKFRVRRAK